MLEINKKTLRRLFLCVCGGIILYWLLHETDRVRGFFGMLSDIFAPFIFGGVVAFILNVPMRGIENSLLKKVKNDKVKRLLAVILTLIGMLLIIALVFWLLIPQLVTTVNSLGPSLYAFFTKAEATVDEFFVKHPQVFEWVKEYTNLENVSIAAMAEKILSMFGNSIASILSGAFSAISGIFSGIFNAFIAVVFSIYCLFQKETLSRQGRKLLYASIKEKFADKIIRILRLTNASFSNFLSGQCVEVCILGSMFAICMAIFRMPYIPLISVVIAITAFIPIVGAWTGCVLGAFLIFVEDPMLAIWFVVMFLVIQQVENSLIYPRVVGSSVGLSGMWVLVAVAIGGELMGVLGMFLMIPLVSVLYTLVTEWTNKRLADSTVSAEKLNPQPPELVSKFREKRQSKRKLNILKRKKKTDDSQ